MYVEEIVLEGFKTYMNRTVISGFDKQFNAITGLNGSGKSNILDAIQFLLGSTSKEMLRLKAGLTELIYKEGFAGIQKASVTIKFKCADKNMRPVGYEANEELIVTRQITKDKVTKFFINGTSSNLSKVRNLFRSVQLNIENPHFLVKQGQITKIINLKPVQLLGMIEQTAGTAYYNKTKLESQKLIEKKEQKLNAINEILSQNIQPQMNKLDADRRRYIAYKDKESLLQKIEEKLGKFELTAKKRHLHQRQIQIANGLQTVAIRKKQAKLNSERLIELQAQQKLLHQKTNNSSLAEYNKIKNLVAQKQSEKAQFKARINKLNQQAIGNKKQIGELQIGLESKRKEKQWEEKQLIQLDKQKEETEGLLQQFGKSNNEKDAQQMIQKKAIQEEQRIQAINTQIKVMNSKKDTIKNEIENDKKIQIQMTETNQNLGKTLQDIEKQIVQIESMRAPQTIEDPQVNNNNLKQLQMQKKRLISQAFQLNFFYHDPYSGFDRSKVKGKVFMLFKIKQKIHEKALEIGAGGRLFNIVVENEVISKQLIERQSFGRNVTIIPNNKIRFKPINGQAIQNAAKIARQMGGMARPAYELINYSRQVQNSIKYVFANFMVCSSSQIAQRIAYNHNRQLSCRCVTYQGDIYEQGTLSGGYMNFNNLILPKFAQLQQIENRIQKEREHFDGKMKRYEIYQKQMNQYRNKQKQLEGKRSRVDKIKNKLMSINLNIQKRDFKKQIQDIEGKIQQLHQQKTQRTNKMNELKNSLKNKKVKNIKEQRQQLEKQVKIHLSKISNAKKKISHLQVQISQIKITIKHLGNTSKDLELEVVEMQKKQRQISSHLKQFQIQFEKLEQQKKEYEKQMMITEAKFKSIVSEQNQLKIAQQNIEREISNIEGGMQNVKRQIADTKRQIQALLQKHPWLDPDEQYEMDETYDYDKAKSDYKILQGQVDKLKRTAKMNIDDHSYQKLQEQYRDLIKKRQTLESDKVTLLNNMHDLDEKRTHTLEKCYQSVKINLGKIFNDLLPGAEAHLGLVDVRDVTKGAELSVHFNGVRKQLGELSGGQRSLLALSFILALLLYKPSPFYILDEIDSALDLSHTENIGYMISQRFPQSQFLLISLKEGMFQNANVLYRVHFAEGQSKVDRQVLNKQKRRSQNV